MSKPTHPILILLAIFALTSLACRYGEVGTAQTIDLPPTLAVTPIDGEQPVDPNQPIAATATLPSNGQPIQPGTPTMITKVDLNVRRGPSTEYDVVIALRAGESAPIIGRSPNGNWWKIQCPTGYSGECWSSAKDPYSYATDAENVPVAPVPALPTATATHTPQPTATATSTSLPTNTPTVTQQPTLAPPERATLTPTAYP